MNKLGGYITKLMTTVLDKEQEEFVIDLAITELNRLKVNIEEFLVKVNKKIPMGRLANIDEYQGTLIWMLSDASSYLNGAIIPVDGGRTSW